MDNNDNALFLPLKYLKEKKKSRDISTKLRIIFIILFEGEKQ